MSSSHPLLKNAEESLDAAELLRKHGYIGFAASRAYFTYFYTAETLLLSRGLEYSRHGQVIAQYGLHFSKNRVLDPAFHRQFITAFNLRNVGDYESTTPIDPIMVDELIEDGRRFLAAASQYLYGLREEAGHDELG